jgi:microcompartment protein CcmK/EutM
MPRSVSAVTIAREFDHIGTDAGDAKMDADSVGAGNEGVVLLLPCQAHYTVGFSTNRPMPLAAVPIAEDG